MIITDPIAKIEVDSLKLLHEDTRVLISMINIHC